jgi:histidine triad (HIT) family protein
MTDCLFCKIALGEIPADVIYQDEACVAFRDISPQAPVHVLVIPRRYIPTFGDADEEDEVLLGHLARVGARVAAQEGVSQSGYRAVVNNGSDANQTVRHLHLHVIGGRQMGWPPG